MMPDILRRIEHRRIDDPALDRAIRDLTTVLNELVERIAPPSTSAGDDLSGEYIKPIRITNNTFSVLLASDDGQLQMLPGLLQKATKLLTVAAEGEIMIADSSGNMQFGQISAGSGITITNANGVITVTNNDPLSGSNLRAGAVSLSAGVSTPVSFSSALASGTPAVAIVSCQESDGSDVPCYISSITTSGFTAECPVDATLIYLGVLYV